MITSIDRKIARCQREIEAARKPSMEEACAAFLVNTAVNIGGGVYTFLTEKDCRQIKGAALDSRETAEVWTPRPSPVAVPPSRKFMVGQKWKRRDGNVVTIEKVDHTNVPALGSDQYWRKEDGLSFDNEPNWDLVALILTPDAEGWTTHTHGKDCPIPGVDEFTVLWRRKDGTTYEEYRSTQLPPKYWKQSEDGEVIAAYKVHQ